MFSGSCHDPTEGKSTVGGCDLHQPAPAAPAAGCSSRPGSAPHFPAVFCMGNRSTPGCLAPPPSLRPGPALLGVPAELFCPDHPAGHSSVQPGGAPPATRRATHCSLDLDLLLLQMPALRGYQHLCSEVYPLLITAVFLQSCSADSAAYSQSRRRLPASHPSHDTQQHLRELHRPLHT